MTDLESLATRLEQAWPESQAELLGEAYEAVFGFSPKHDEWYGIEPEQRAQGRYFTAMLDCGAYLSAAEMLVPDGWRISQWREGGDGGFWAQLKQRRVNIYETGEAYSMALALAAACVRAINQGAHENG